MTRRGWISLAVMIAAAAIVLWILYGRVLVDVLSRSIE